MKKNILGFIGLAIAMVLFTGCGDKEPITPQEKKAEQIEIAETLPAWVVNPKVEGGIAAVGLAGYSKHGMQVMLPQAEMDGRAKLAGQIQTIVSQLRKKAMRHVKINESDDFENAFNEATKEVIKEMPMSGVRRINMFTAKNGDLYVHMIIEKRAVSEHLNDMKETYKKHMEEAKLTRESLDKGMEVLDDMMKDLDKEIQR